MSVGTSGIEMRGVDGGERRPVEGLGARPSSLRAGVREGAGARLVVLMGVSGSGKSTIGRTLARQLGWSFHDADDYHPAANVSKMHRGIPLTDADRVPWLEALARLIDGAGARGADIILACSALKRAYRDFLHGSRGPVSYVLLDASPELIRRRLLARRGHFMDPNLLASQFELLEVPEDAVRVDIAPGP